MAGAAPPLQPIAAGGDDMIKKVDVILDCKGSMLKLWNKLIAKKTNLVWKNGNLSIFKETGKLICVLKLEEYVLKTFFLPGATEGRVLFQKDKSWVDILLSHQQLKVDFYDITIHWLYSRKLRVVCSLEDNFGLSQVASKDLGGGPDVYGGAEVTVHMDTKKMVLERGNKTLIVDFGTKQFSIQSDDTDNCVKMDFVYPGRPGRPYLKIVFTGAELNYLAYFLAITMEDNHLNYTHVKKEVLPPDSVRRANDKSDSELG